MHLARILQYSTDKVRRFITDTHNNIKQILYSNFVLYMYNRMLYM